MLLPGETLFWCRRKLEQLLKALRHNRLESPRTRRCNSPDCENEQWYLRQIFSVYYTVSIFSRFILCLCVSKTFSSQQWIAGVKRSVLLCSECTRFSNIMFRGKSIQTRCLQHEKYEIQLKNAINVSSHPSYRDETLETKYPTFQLLILARPLL